VSKLLQRLSDASRSGVYRTTSAAPVLDATRGSGLDVVLIRLQGRADRDAVLGALAEALAFPAWFGSNWDALEDCLADLSWRREAGRVLLFEGLEPGDELGILVDILAGSAEFWAGQGKPFFAVFVDPDGALPLAALFREK
jgi:hypothetical protein